MGKTELSDYQKGLIDALAGVVELIIQECDDEMIDILLDKLKLKRA